MKKFTIFLILHLQGQGSDSQGPNAFIAYYVKTLSMKCYGNPEMLVNITCRLKPINWEKTVAIMNSDLVGVIRNATLRLELFKYTYTNEFRPFLINISLNLCQMLETGKGHSYGKMLTNLLPYFTSLNHTCPYWGHLEAHGIYLDSQLIPFVIPSAKYKFVATFYEGWPLVHIGTVAVIASVDKRNNIPRTRPIIDERYADTVASQGINSFSPYYVKTLSINCYGNPDMLVNITCKLKPISWEKTVAIMDSDLVGVIRNLTLRVELFKYTYTNEFRPFVINITLNLCQLFETGKGNSYGKVFLYWLANFSSINHSCPYWGHLKAHGIYLDSQFIPFLVPSDKYKLVFTFYDGWPLVHIGTVIVIGSVIDKNRMPRNRPERKPKRTLITHNSNYYTYL